MLLRRILERIVIKNVVKKLLNIAFYDIIKKKVS